MRLILSIFFFLLQFTLVATPQEAARRMQAFLLIGDPQRAFHEGKKALKTYPQDLLVSEWAIKSFGVAGDENEMLTLWHQLHDVCPERALQQDLLEEMCWAILKKGKYASGLSTQLVAIIAAALTQDIRALPFLLDGMGHPNAQLREISVELASYYGDSPLRQELTRLLRDETVHDVRLALYRAIGELHMEECLPHLMDCVANPKKGVKEKLVSIEAIILMKEAVSQEQLAILATSHRAGLRQLACEVISHCELKNESFLLTQLICDPQPEVCAAALRAWGVLRYGLTPEIKKLASEALNPEVGITAAWVWLIEEFKEGEKAMVRWLEHDLPHARAVAASAVAMAGPSGIPLAKNYLKEAKDPFVKLNLALALAGQRECREEVCSTLEEALQSSDRWMFSENNSFKTLEKSTLSHKLSITNYPEVVNQTVRLELLNLLAILDSPLSVDALKSFLKECHWDVTGLAAETLLGEGDETAIDLVRSLLEDPNHEIRTEAALVLATWGKDHSATPTLLESYAQGDRQLKLKILEALGRMGDKSVIPFLIDRLQEPSLLLRMAAASVLIQTLNH